MTTVWVTIAVLAVGTAIIKAAGPVAMGGKQLSVATQSVVRLIAPAILSALIVYETFIDGDGGVTIDARIVGVIAAIAALAARIPMIAVMLVAAGSTAAVRAIGIG